MKSLIALETDRQTDWKNASRVFCSHQPRISTVRDVSKTKLTASRRSLGKPRGGGVKETREGRGTGRGHKWKLVKARCRVWRSYNYDVIWGEMWTYVNSDPQLFEYRWTIA